MRLAAIIIGIWFVILLVWVQIEQGINRSKPLTEQQVQAMQLETRARAIARYGEYEE